jgi:lysophospholipase L1-like esterase
MKIFPGFRRVRLVVCGCIVLAAAPAFADGNGTYQFYFGPNAPAAGYSPVTPTTVYTDTLGYGFEPGADVTVLNEPGATGPALTSTEPFYFSAAVPEGNYKVTVTFGDAKAATDTTVKAELRRLMLAHVTTAPGEFVTKSFIVNVRQPQIAGGGEVKLKAPRETEQEAWDWDNRITLEFDGPHPVVDALSIEPVNVPTVFIVGDSTSCDQSREPYNSWGQSITAFFKPDIAVANHGESGETVADSLARKRFAKVWSLMKPGDYLLVQFGHNDMKPPGTVEGYTQGLEKVADETKAHGGTLVLITPMNRHTFDDSGNVTNSFGGYPDAVRAVAKEKGVALIDLNLLSKTLYESFGPDGSLVLFAPTARGHDMTHHSDFGSYELAKCIVLGVQQDKLDLANHVVDGFAFDPAHPDKPEDFKVPASPTPRGDRPLGDVTNTSAPASAAPPASSSTTTPAPTSSSQ